MENHLPCPKCKNDFQTGPNWNEYDSIVWWDCECGLSGPDAKTVNEAANLWDDMVRKINSNVKLTGGLTAESEKTNE